MIEARDSAGGESAEKIVIERTYDAQVEELWNLWTTKDGFESWWGPEGFRAEVYTIEGKQGGTLHYEMIADTPEMVEAMRQMGSPKSHEVRARFSEFQPHDRLVITSVIDFLPGVTPYESAILVEFYAAAENARMVVTLSGMHNAEFTQMQKMGFTSQLSKLDRRYGWSEPASM